jgi:DNA-binding transcriptional ArsR family regulator
MDFEEDMYSSIFLALKHPVRRKIMRILSENALTYTQVLNRLEVETGFLNYHLENLRGLVTKGKDDRYRLSEFGEAALALIAGVEEPVKEKSSGLRILGFRINSTYIAMTVATILMVSNVFWVYAYQGLSREKTNALGEILIQTGGYLGESISILNSVVIEGKIDLELWSIVFLRDLIQLSRQYGLVVSLDIDHRQQWSQIKAATDSVVDFVNELIQTYADYAFMDITPEQSVHISKMRDFFLNTQLKAFPTKIVIGSNPQVNIVDSEITEVMELAEQLQTDLKLARKAFNLFTL